MFISPLTVAVQLTFVDRDGNQAQTQFRLLSSLSIAEIDTIATQIETAMKAISTAVLIRRAIVYRVRNRPIPAAPPESNVQRYLDLLYTNVNLATSLAIPSPLEDLWVQDTWGADSILDKRNPSILALVNALLVELGNTVDEQGNPVDPLLLNGVKTL